jgi:hypothetical protein
MTKSLKYLLVLSLLINSLILYSQDTIVVLSGEKIITSKCNYDENTKTFFYQNSKNQTKTLSYEGVFSVIKFNEKEKVYYTSDSINDAGNFVYTESEMRDYLKGRISAKNKKECLTLVGGGVFVTAGTTFAALSFIPAIPIIPVAYIAVSNAIPISEKIIIKKYPQYSNNEPFILGYKDSAEAKRTKNAIIGGTAGLILGIVSGIIYSSVNN